MSLVGGRHSETTKKSWVRSILNNAFSIDSPESSINKDKIIKKIDYEHPLFTKDTIEAQYNKNLINGVNNTYFCGAYWGNGFHEDGVNSALDVCKKFGMEL